ncbi:MAG TPA: hypothetical protein VFW11_03100 [Cyclobacteriaceae bacterium]|nr:hypothetical protein [Cyclobacteriaceae bacterium]
MSGKKSIYLMLALALPIGVFLFLKFFGKNEFHVEPLFQSSVPVDTMCNLSYTFPYVIPDSVVRQFDINDHELTLVVFEKDEMKNEIEREVRRVEEEFSSEPVRIIRQEGVDTGVQYLRRCTFLMNDNVTISLVDKRGRIFGQYDGSSLEDMDRLIVEMKIILKKY